MNQKQTNETNEIEIDLGRILHAILNRAWIIMIVSVLGAAIMFAVTRFLITPLYQSSAMFYVNNNSLSVGNASLSISSSDLVTSRGLVDSYIVILNTKETLNEVIDQAGSGRSYGELKGMISAGAVSETEIFRVTVTSPDPAEAERLADAIAEVLPDRIGAIIEGSSAKIVDTAVQPSGPSSPSYSRNVMIGFILGFLLSAGLVVIREIFDTAIHTEEDIAEVCKQPVLTTVPNLLTSAHGGYEYVYDRDAEKKKTAVPRTPALFGDNISFAASESYKLLRTKLQFSFSDESECRIIGVSSSFSGEGKSLTSINLAYSLSQLGNKVMLIDCDMRRPTLAEKLNIQKKPGLSSYLTGQRNLADLIQNCGIAKNERAFHVISAGQNPPNPVELLSSVRMGQMLDVLKKVYDYIIFDLPPVSEVSDAIAVAKHTSGILLVARQNVCDRSALAETVRQFEFVEGKILGIVFNCVDGGSGKGYYKKYYKGGYRKYGYRKYGYRKYGYRRYGYKGYYGPNGRDDANKGLTDARDMKLEE